MRTSPQLRKYKTKIKLFLSVFSSHFSSVIRKLKGTFWSIFSLVAYTFPSIGRKLEIICKIMTDVILQGKSSSVSKVFQSILLHRWVKWEKQTWLTKLFIPSKITLTITLVLASPRTNFALCCICQDPFLFRSLNHRHLLVSWVCLAHDVASILPNDMITIFTATPK